MFTKPTIGTGSHNVTKKVEQKKEKNQVLYQHLKILTST